MKKQTVYKRSCNYKKTSNTLDFCHKNNICNFTNNRDCLQDKTKVLEETKSKLEEIRTKPNNERTDEDFVNLVIFNDKIKQIENLYFKCCKL